MRNVGIRHRNKQTAEFEARPTQVAILDQAGNTKRYDLETEQAELDWLLGRFATKYRVAEAGEDISSIPEHQVQWKKLKAGQSAEQFVTRQNPETKKPDIQVAHVPCEFDGYQAGDRVGLVLSGSSNPLAYALSRRGEEIGATAYRLNTKTIYEQRELKKREKDDDALTVAELVRDNVELFYPITRRDRETIALTEIYHQRQEVQRARIGCEQRMIQHLIGQIFMNPEGRYPERSVELLYGERKANDVIYQALVKEEKAREKELAKAVALFDVFNVLFANMVGVGVMIATRIIVAVKDVRLFATKHKMKAYMGAHVMQGGRFGDLPRGAQFPRRRAGMHANWHKDGRQALYLLADQFNKRPDSPWGQQLLKNKLHFRAVHPEAIEVEEPVVRFVEGRPVVTEKTRLRKIWTDGHVLNSAKWRTITQFVEVLWTDWTELERRIAAGLPPGDPSYSWMKPPVKQIEGGAIPEGTEQSEPTDVDESAA